MICWFQPSMEGCLHVLPRWNNKVFNYEVWCIPSHSVCPLRGLSELILILHPNYGPVHEQNTCEQLLSPPEIRGLLPQ